MSKSSVPIIVFPHESDTTLSVSFATTSTRSTFTPPSFPSEGASSISTASRPRNGAWSRLSPTSVPTAVFQSEHESDNTEFDVEFDVEKERRSRRRWLLSGRYRTYHYWAIAINRIRKHRWVIIGLTLAMIVFHFIYSAAFHPSHGPGELSEARQPAASKRFAQIHDKRITQVHETKDEVSISPTEEIEHLIRRAELQWEEKLGRQSKTLKAAVDEYQKRYGQVPPKGFDYWWYYCLDNNIQLVDEYDQIHRDLHLFRAISPFGLRQRLARFLKASGMYTLSIQDRQLEYTLGEDVDHIHGASARVKAQMNFLKPFIEHLEDGFTVVYNIHDYPRVLVPYSHQSELQDRIEDGEHWNEEESIDTSNRGFPKACPPSSLAVRQTHLERKGKRLALSKPKSMFIDDWKASMDVCNNLHLLENHGSFAGRRAAHSPLEPIFSMAKTSTHSDILTIPMDFWSLDSPHTAWENKTDNRLFWRGKTTGNAYSTKSDWRKEHRFRLVSMAEEGKLVTKDDKGEEVVQEVDKSWLDMGFVGQASQCDEADGTCKEIHERYTWLPRSGIDSSAYKYVIDVDGNAWSARFNRLLNSNSLVFKSTVYPEWWADRIEPWYHFVPINVDYSDLPEALHYFREHDSEAERIANNGRAWAQTMWREADMRAYVFRLYLEWQRLLAPNRSKMNFDYNPTMERLS